MELMALKQLLKEQQVQFQLLKTPRPILTLADAKKYFPAKAVTMTLILQADGEYLALLPAACKGKADLQKLKQLLACTKLVLARPEQVLEHTGYEICNLPLYGHGLPVIFDKELLQQEFIYGGSGNADYTLKIDPHGLLSISQVKLIYE